MAKAQVQGLTAQQFEPVREVLEDGLGEFTSGGAAFAVWARDRLVVDLWGGSANGRPWERSTRAVLMSTTKGIATVAFAQLVQDGLIDVDAPVSRYWPEFAVAGKASVQVRDILTHSVGLVSVDDYEELVGPAGMGWDREQEIVERLAAGRPEWEPGTAFGYHGLTFGWLIAELTRRVTGLTIGTLLRQRVIDPLGLELDLGTDRTTQQLVAYPALSPDLLNEMQSAMNDTRVARAYLTSGGRNILTDIDDYCRNPRFLEIELPALNATGTARAIATLYGQLANPGAGLLLLPATLEEFRRPQISGIDVVEGEPGCRALGFALRPDKALGGSTGEDDWGPGLHTFGHPGYGGQIAFTDPDTELAVGFIRTLYSHSSPLGRDLINAVYACL